MRRLALGTLAKARTSTIVRSGRPIHSANACAISMAEEEEAEPDHATCQREEDEEEERGRS